jgi:ABC-type Mn2+/Zn2+ transport system ATPase subunit
MSEPLVRLEGVTLGHRRKPLLAGVTLAIRAGDRLGVVGPNGAGKSTLLSTLLGLIPPIAGTVWRQPGLTVGFVPQRGRHDPLFGLRSSEVVASGGLGTCRGFCERLRMAPPEEVRKALALLGLEHLERAPFRDLSGGQQQRVLLARALVRRPQLLILDEPAAGMDLPSERDLMELVSRLSAEQRLALVFVTHGLGAAAEHADRLALLDKDQGLFAVDDVAALMTTERLSALYRRPIEVVDLGGQKLIRPAPRSPAP